MKPLKNQPVAWQWLWFGPPTAPLPSLATCVNTSSTVTNTNSYSTVTNNAQRARASRSLPGTLRWPYHLSRSLSVSGVRSDKKMVE